jgi:aminopeptidase N
VMTHARPQDSWLHEGYGAYMQPVYAQEITGAIGYFDRMFDAYMSTSHCEPVVNPAASDVGQAFDNRDIYTKGAWMLHSLRQLIGDEAFWAGTRKLIYGTTEPWSLPYPISARYRTTEEFIDIMSEVSGQDIAWLVEAYLYEADMPVLESERANGRLSLRWKVPNARPFPMPVTVSVAGRNTELDMSNGHNSIAAPDSAWVMIDPDSRFLRALPIIGDCEAQTGVKVNYNIDRYTRMAKEYGWQRD